MDGRNSDEENDKKEDKTDDERLMNDGVRLELRL